MNKEEKAKLWSDRIQQCQTSGKTCKQWCAENGIPLSTMGYWIRRLVKEEPASESEQDMVFVRLPSEQETARKLLEYSCAVTPQVRQTGNRLSGLAGTAYASLLA